MLKRKEKQQRMLNSFNLKVGDKVKFFNDDIYIVKENGFEYYLQYNDEEEAHSDIYNLYQFDWEKVKEKRIFKLGKIPCEGITCEYCPFKYLSCREVNVLENNTLYEVFDIFKEEFNNIDYINVDWDKIKNELDKEIEVIDV